MLAKWLPLKSAAVLLTRTMADGVADTSILRCDTRDWIV